MKKLLYILIIMLLINLYQIYEYRRGKITHNDFKPYIQSFEEIMSIDAKNVPITYINVPQVYAGACIKYTDFFKEIKVDRITWNLLSKYQKEELVFHELGHCVLNLPHDDTMIKYQNETIPRSLMYPSVLDSFIYKKYRDYYIQELIYKKNLQN